MHLYWTCKLLNKLNEYVAANFVEHPSINNMVIQYFIEVVGGKHDANAFNEKIKELKKKLKELLGDALHPADQPSHTQEHTQTHST